MTSIVSILLVAYRIYAIYYCTKKARQLGRNVVGWGIFSFLLPLIAVMVIMNIKPMSVQRHTYSPNDPIDKI